MTTFGTDRLFLQMGGSYSKRGLRIMLTFSIYFLIASDYFATQDRLTRTGDLKALHLSGR